MDLTLHKQNLNSNGERKKRLAAPGTRIEASEELNLPLEHSFPGCSKGHGEVSVHDWGSLDPLAGLCDVCYEG